MLRYQHCQIAQHRIELEHLRPSMASMVPEYHTISAIIYAVDASHSMPTLDMTGITVEVKCGPVRE